MIQSIFDDRFLSVEQNDLFHAGRAYRNNRFKMTRSLSTYFIVEREKSITCLKRNQSRRRAFGRAHRGILSHYKTNSLDEMSKLHRQIDWLISLYSMFQMFLHFVFPSLHLACSLALQKLSKPLHLTWRTCCETLY